MENISLEHAIELLNMNHGIKTFTEKLPLLKCLGRVLAEDVFANHDQPPFDRSPLDGYAVRGEDLLLATVDTPVALTVVDEVCAGHVSARQLEEGQTIRIMTGGKMPDGSNAVVRQEDTDLAMDVVKVFKRVAPYKNYCYAGEDYKAGTRLMDEGDKLTAYHVGLLASNGIAEVSVKRPLKIGLLSTGDELMEPTEALKDGKIYNSNLYTLSARLMELGCEPLIMGTIQDDVELGVNLIKEFAPRVDMVITTGGVSVGKMDILHPILKELDAKRLFWKITMKPGSPAIASIFNGKLILSLSGNPSAAATTFELFFRSILSTAMKCNELKMKPIKGVMAENFMKRSPNRRLLRAYYKGGQVYLTKGNQSSGALMSMVGCNCFVDIPAGSGKLLAGYDVDVLLL